MDNNSLSHIPYAPWLENTLRDLIGLNVKGICIIATTEEGDIYNNYHNVTMADKLVMAGVIQQDATIDSLAAAGYIDYADEDEEDLYGEEED